jgi:antitoxin component YwqK of YwqJK toxin-antitoxin module
VGSDNFADAACTVNGSDIESYENGERKLTGTYSNGFKSGLWTHYDESGNTTLSERYESG